MCNEMTDMLQTYSDMYTDAYGIRPRHHQYFNSVEEIEIELKTLETAIEKRIERERIMEQQAISEFEESVIKVINIGAGNRKTAIQWLIEAAGSPTDIDYFCYCNGLPYNYLSDVA